MKPSETLKELNSRYSSVPKSRVPAVLAIKLTHPNLHPNMLSKYKRILRFFGGSKKPGQSVRDFVQGHGGINRCLAEEKNWRARQQTHHRKRRKH
jgi:hypothetical protein